MAFDSTDFSTTTYPLGFYVPSANAPASVRTSAEKNFLMTRIRGTNKLRKKHVARVLQLAALIEGNPAILDQTAWARPEDGYPTFPMMIRNHTLSGKAGIRDGCRGCVGGLAQALFGVSPFTPPGIAGMKLLGLSVPQAGRLFYDTRQLQPAFIAHLLREYAATGMV